MKTQTLTCDAGDLKKAIELIGWWESVPPWFDDISEDQNEDVESKLQVLLPDVDFLYDDEYFSIDREVWGETIVFTCTDVDGKPQFVLTIAAE